MSYTSANLQNGLGERGALKLSLKLFKLKIVLIDID
jgi:hypothetical protein